VINKNGKQRVSKDPKPKKFINTDPNNREDYTSREDEIISTNYEPEENNPPSEIIYPYQPTRLPFPRDTKVSPKDSRRIYYTIWKPRIHTKKTSFL
jgi:hypothetical protein